MGQSVFSSMKGKKMPEPWEEAINLRSCLKSQFIPTHQARCSLSKPFRNAAGKGQGERGWSLSRRPQGQEGGWAFMEVTPPPPTIQVDLIFFSV